MKTGSGRISANLPGLIPWAFLVSVAFVFFHQIYISRAGPNAVYMDSLRMLHQWYEWRAGNITFHEYWNQGSHRGFVFQAILGLNAEFFSLDPLLANRLTGFLIAISAFLVAFGALSTLPIEKKLVNFRAHIFFAIFLSGALFFSLAGFEVLTLDLGLGLWLKNTLVIIFFIFSSLLQQKRRESLSLLVLLVLGPLIVLFFGMGWSYAFVSAFLSVQFVLWACEFLTSGKVVSKRNIFVSIALLTSIFFYILLGQSSAASSSTKNTAPAVEDLIELVSTALGSSLIGAESLPYYSIPPIVLTFLGVVSSGILTVVTIVSLARRRIVKLAFPLYLIAYAVFVAISVCLARGGMGNAAVVASRYFMDFLLLPVGLIWLLVDAIINSVSRRESVGWKFVFIVYCGLIIAGLSLTNFREWRAAPYRAQAFQEMNSVLFEGKIDEKKAKLLQAPLKDAQRGRESLFVNKLSIFSQDIEQCKISALDYNGEWYAPEADGRWMGQSAGIRLSRCDCPLLISLFLPGNFEGREIRIIGVPLSQSTLDLRPGAGYSIKLPASAGPSRVLFSVSRITIPAELPNVSNDSRRLGVFFSHVAYSCDAQ
ncbi:hypothetical protein FHR53_001300 [Xanthomonas arboricola]|uniref:hypothetical protein n=1 Tax=Xanthomonas cannabis TaxID=1885674 RepID=UPI00141BF111|nr:hypothetical protein [Xanthomonas cannabis]NIK01939.1 hypothetical protein [Xanthomonas cannabis]NIK64574.1 hypothetical protein [Xanthomonas cannabis]